MIQHVYLVQAVELMLTDALVKANNYLEISSCIQDPSEYWKVVNLVSEALLVMPQLFIEYYKLFLTFFNSVG